jgi:hypothetical protein
MAAVKEGNHTNAVVDMDWHVSQIDSLCRWEVVYHFLMILNCCYGAVASEIRHPVDSYSLFLVEIRLLT